MAQGDIQGTILRYPAEVGRFNKWVRFDVRRGRHVGRASATVPETGDKDSVVMSAALYLPTSALRSATSVRYDTTQFSGMLMEMAANALSPLMNAKLGVNGTQALGQAKDALWNAAQRIKNDANATDVGGWLQKIASTGSPILNEARRIAGEAGISVPELITEDQLSAATGTRANPRTDILFQAQEYRTWTFEYIFIPRTYQEADHIQKIVNMFNFYMLPSYRAGGLGKVAAFMMGYPYEFTIGIYGTDPDTRQNVGDFQNNTPGTLQIGEEPLAPDTGFTLKNVQRIGRCVLRNLSVDHAGAQKVAFVSEKGKKELFPLVTLLTLDFQEVILLGRDNPEFFGGMPAGQDPRG